MTLPDAKRGDASVNNDISGITIDLKGGIKDRVVADLIIRSRHRSHDNGASAGNGPWNCH